MNKKDFLKLICVKGCPASGKSTWAKEQVAKNPFKTARVCRDDFRTMLNNYVFSTENEDLVQSLRDQAIVAALSKGYNVIVDETNLDKAAFGKYVKLVKKLNINCEIIEKPFYAPLETLLERNSKRDRVVPEHVIKSMWARSGEEKFKRYEGKIETVLCSDNSDLSDLSLKLNDESLPKCIVVDLDGTISLFNISEDEIRHPMAHVRNPYAAANSNNDYPNEPVVKLVNLFYNDGYKIFFCSGREDRYRPQTVEFLTKYLDKNVTYDLLMRSSGDYRKDDEVKEQLLRSHIAGKYRIFVSLDDRNVMIEFYRKLGIPTWQVNEGNF